MILGIHGSVRGGLSQALEEGAAAGCRALQMLPYTRHTRPAAEQLAAFRAAREKSGLSRLLIHSRFVPALASGDPLRRKRSVELLAYELGLAEDLGGEAYVLHAGAYSEGTTLEDGLRAAAESIDEAVERSGFRGPILLENVPGGGRRMGGPLEELAKLREALSCRTGVCLDTAHAWAQGYDLSTAEGMLKFLSRAHRLFGDGLRAFHLNDSHALLGSCVESHAHWGEGRLGKEGIAALLSRDDLDDVVAIVETPKEPGADARNLAWLSALKG